MQTELRSPLKDPPLRQPGQSLDQQLDDLLDGKVLWYGEHHPEARSPLPWVVIACLLTAIAAYRLSGIWRRIRHIKLGREGERVVGQFLEGFRAQGAEVFHDIPGEGFNLDHVLIARQGIFVIETKTWSKRGREEIATQDGRLFKGGREVDWQPVNQALANARWLSEWLKGTTRQVFAVQPVVLVPGWYVKMDAATKAKAWVMPEKGFWAFFDREPVKLSDDDVALAASRLAERSRGRL